MRLANTIRWPLAAALLLLATGAAAAERSVTLAVENMTCASCPYIVEKSLERVDGVIDAQVSFEQRTAVVHYDDARTGIEALTGATANAGYPSRVAEASP